MNRMITSIIVCLVMTAAIAQTKADSEVCYAMSSPNMRTGKILEADADNGVYSFVATGIQNSYRLWRYIWLTVTRK